MSQKFPMSIWVYTPIDEFTPDEVNVWADAGVTVSMSPKVIYGKDDLTKLIPFLDVAEKRGIKLIAFINGLEYDSYETIGEEKYTERFTEVYEVLKHPALHGFYVGDEPRTKGNLEATWGAVKVQKKIAPHLEPFFDLNLELDDKEYENIGNRNFRQWLKEFGEDTGLKSYSYELYEQVVDDAGIEIYYDALNKLTEHAKASGVDYWTTVLSSTHLTFRFLTEYDVHWQVNVAVACGTRGIMWFRFYDRLIAPNYHGSPIDEYGNKTERYYMILRAQRKLNDHYGELLMTLKHRKTYLTPVSRGGYEVLTPESNCSIKRILSDLPAVVGFFESEEGEEYICLVNGSQDTPGVFGLDFDRDKYEVEEILLNGKLRIPYAHKHTAGFWDGQWLYPGQMNMFSIKEKNKG